MSQQNKYGAIVVAVLAMLGLMAWSGLRSPSAPSAAPTPAVSVVELTEAEYKVQRLLREVYKETIMDENLVRSAGEVSLQFSLDPTKSDLRGLNMNLTRMAQTQAKWGLSDDDMKARIAKLAKYLQNE
jgi:hypothetical protein